MIKANTRRLEASVTYAICTQLHNLGWVVDEKNPNNNITQQRPKTIKQRNILKEANLGKSLYPDFVLYESGTTRPIAIIEAKRPGETLNKALKQAASYAKPLGIEIIFAYNDTFVEAKHLVTNRNLKIDGEDVRQFIDQYTLFRFINEGPEILSAPKEVQLSRSELIRIFKRQANYLREAGLQNGLDRFGAFSDILFLKLFEEVCQIREAAGEKSPLPSYIRWKHFQEMPSLDRLDYVKNTVWHEMRKHFGTIFSEELPIESSEIFGDIVDDLSNYNFTGTDSDVKGDAFEYFLKNAYQGIKIKDLGEYFTPRNIVRSMVSMVNPKFGEKIYDPFCGTGGFLIESFRYIGLRVKESKEHKKRLKEETVYGAEVAATARIARMNMILFGDGHSNVIRHDSFRYPVHEKYDVVLTNPPYSQPTRHGNLYEIPSSNGDIIAMQHCFKSLKPNGRGAILIKDDFLTEGGETGMTRDMILAQSKNVNIVSLPRRLFEPYTPTKTSIVYFEKKGTKNTVSFHIVNNVGHTLGARKKSIPENDLPYVLESFNNNSGGYVFDVNTIRKKNSLWVYNYIEVLPHGNGPFEELGDYIQKSGVSFHPSDYSEEIFQILGVSNQHGIFLNEEKKGENIKQKYIRVAAGDLAYNPHRVNVGSIGTVPPELDSGIISGIYVVFRPIDEKILPQSYLSRLLKSNSYLQIIRAYDTQGAVRANLSYEQLCRIKIVLPTAEKMKEFTQEHSKIERFKNEIVKKEAEISKFLNGNKNVNLVRVD